MIFASLEYLIFLPIVFLLYWTICRNSKNLQNGLLLLASLTFYCWWDIRTLPLLLITAMSTYAAGWMMEKFTANQGYRKLILWLTLLLNLGILFVFKYFNFFILSFKDTFSLFGTELNISTLKIVLPVGISFYTFTSLSYTIDVYLRKVPVSKDVLAYLSYATFFPSILSGPISRAQTQLSQYSTLRSFDRNKCVSACRLMLWGGVIKTCLAERLGIYVDAVYTNFLLHSGITLFVTSIFYTIQIYADFAGYSLMAIGSARLLGIELQPNFQQPYFARTVTEFWRRWHISLTTWFRDYIYFPLGGNRVGRTRWIINTMVVFVVSGIWHGAAYTFLIWGTFHGVCIVMERIIYGDKIRRIEPRMSLANLFRMLFTFSVVSFALIFFRAASLSDALAIIGKILTFSPGLFIDKTTLFHALPFLVLVFCAEFAEEFFPGKWTFLNSKHPIIRWATYIMLSLAVLLFGVLDSGSFIYFQF